MREEGSGTKGKIVIITIFGPFVFFLRSVFNGSHKLKKKSRGRLPAGVSYSFDFPSFFFFHHLGFFFSYLPIRMSSPQTSI
jgi:hypothetical protein